MMARSLSQWDCTELARQLMAAKIVGGISASTVRRILNSHKLKPGALSFMAITKSPTGCSICKNHKRN
jgi:hypothetical protein